MSGQRGQIWVLKGLIYGGRCCFKKFPKEGTACRNGQTIFPSPSCQMESWSHAMIKQKFLLEVSKAIRTVDGSRSEGSRVMRSLNLTFPNMGFCIIGSDYQEFCFEIKSSHVFVKKWGKGNVQSRNQWFCHPNSIRKI